MSRPRKTGLDYFPHDVDVTTDPKIEPAIMRYGAAAYAFYFVHLEYCYRSDDLTIDVSAETGVEMREVIQRKLHINEQLYENILQSFIRHGAFDAEFYAKTGKLTSRGIRKRAMKVLEKREREAERYDKKVSAAETGAETTQSKVKKSIAKKSTEKKRKVQKDTPPLCEKSSQSGEVQCAENEKADTQGSNASSTKHTQESNASSKTHTVKVQCAEYVSMTNDEHEKLLATYGAADTARMVEKLDNYKGSTGKRYKSDYRAILSWVADEVLKSKREAQAGRQKSSLGLLQELYDEEVSVSGTGRDNQTVCDI